MAGHVRGELQSVAAMAKEAPAYLCPHVFAGTHPVLLVVHEGGDWQYLCGGDHDPDSLPRVVCRTHVLDSDPSLAALADLKEGWEAERTSVDAPWRRTIVPEES